MAGPDLTNDRAFAEKVRQKLSTIPMLRDVQYGQALDYPAINVDLNRDLGGVLGVTSDSVSRALAPITSSSRFTQPIYWAAANTGISYQVQVEVPQQQVKSVEDVRNVPVQTSRGTSVLLRNVANVKSDTVSGEYDRYNGQRLVSVTANIEGASLGDAAAKVSVALKELGSPPPKVTVMVRGQVAPLEELLSSLRSGLLIAAFVIFLVLVANFQSVPLALATISAAPAVIAGVALTLWVTGTTLNMKSYMGAITALGVAVANAILLITFAERSRFGGRSAAEAAHDGAVSRLRPILMTSTAMVSGMLPLALGLGASGQETAPLGRAVMGGLVFATATTLLVLPSIFSLIRARADRQSPSLDPDDPHATSGATLQGSA